MEELFKKVINAPESRKHSLTLWARCFRGVTYIQIAVHRKDEYGHSADVEDSADSYYDSIETIAAWLDRWIDVISEEAKHDNEGTG